MSKKIQRPPVEIILKKYLRHFAVTTLEKVSLAGAEEMFVQIISDFKSGRLSLDEFSVLGATFFHVVGKRHHHSELFKVSLAASELGFFIRTPATYKNIELFLKQIDEFYARSESR